MADAQAPDPGGVTIREARTKADRKAFVRAWRPALADDPNMIAPLELERLDHLNPRKNPFFQHAEVALFLAERDGKVVGRISAQDCTLMRQHHDAGMFGFIDGVDDPAVFAALTGAAESWLRARGLRRVRGPFSLSINDEAGLLVDGFDTPPFVMMGHAKPWYGAHLEALGYEKAADLLAYRMAALSMLESKRIRPFLARVAADDSITLRPLDMTRYDDDMRAMMEVFNDAWSDNWGFVPFTEAEVRKLSADLKMVLRPEFVWIAEVRGAPAAFIVALPNLNEAIADLNGRLFPFGLIKLLWRVKRGRVHSGRVPLMGVRKAHQSTLLGACLAFALMERMTRVSHAIGFHQAELSWILERNTDMRRMIEATGGEAYKTYRVYEKALT